MNKRGLDKLRRRAEENLIVNDRKIKGMGKADLAAMAHELAVHQAELEIQNEELLQSRALVEETGDRYQKLFDFAPVGYFTLDEHNRIIEVNLTGCQLLKADKGKLKNKIFTRFIADGETDKFYLHRKKALKTELSQNFILQMKKDDGTLFYAELDIIKDYGEKLRLAVSDISERKKAEDAQRQGEEKYRTLFNSIDEGFCVVEVIFDSKNKPIDYRFLEVNPSFEKQTGLHDAAGKLMRSLAPAHEEHWFRIYGRIALTGKSERFVNEARALNRWYDVYAFRVGTPESRKVAILFNDITARKKSEADLAKARDELEIKILERTAELKETEQRLRQRAEELETVMNVVPAAIWVAHDPACHNITGNQTANRFYEAEEGENVSAGPAAGEPVPERRFFLNGKELTAEELPMQEAAARNVDIEGSEFNVLLPSGKSRTLWGSASPLRNNDGQVRGVVAAFLDITDRTREQEKLKESENRFSKAFHSSPVALSISRINDGTFIDVNQSFLNMYGYKREELIGQKATELNIYDNPVERKEIVRRLDRQGKVLNYEVTARTKAGAEINALTSAEKIEINGQAHIIWTTIDITDRKKAEERLKESEEKFSKIFHSSPIGLVMTHLPEGQWVDANENYLKMLEYTREEVIGRTSNDLNLYPDANKRAEIFRVLREEGKISNFELRVRTKTGKIIETLSSVEIFNLNNEVYSLSTNVDITARKQAEAEINRLNRELKAIWECDQAIVHANNEQTLLNEVCLILHLTANYPMVWIGTVENDENKTVRPIAWSGDEAYLRNVNITWADTARGRGPTGSAGREGKTYFFQDFITAPAAAPWRDAALALGYRSSIALPLAGEDGTVFAVFTLYSSEPNYFNPSEIKLLEMLAGDIAFGINGLREREKRKSAESEILHLASFPELNPNPIIELDFSGNVKYTNNAAKSDLPLIAQGHKRPFLMDLFDAIQKDKTHSVTKDINTGVSWWEQTIVYVPGTNSYLLYGRNITSRKIAEESLRQSEEKFRSMNFTMNEGVCLHEIIYDESGKGVDYKILDINPAYEQITGLTREKAIGKTASELYGTGTPPYFDIYERVATSGKPESFETYFPPMQKYFGISVFSPEKGRFGTVFNDITERRRSEQEKQQLMDKITDAQKQTLSDLAAMTVLQKLGALSLRERNLDSILTEIVDAAIAISGADFGNIQLLDPDTHDLKIVAYRGYPDWWLGFWSTVSKGKGTCGTALERGERVIVEDVEQSPIFIGTPTLDIQLKADIRGIQSTPLVSRSGKTLGMFSTQYKMPHRPDDRTLRLLDLLARQAADIIESTEAADTLKQRTSELEASNKELEAFSYSVSHDLRAPLRSITGFSNVLLEDYIDKLDAEGKSYLKKTSDSGELMGQLMDDLLKLSRVTRGDLTMEKLDLSAMARKIVDELREDEPNREVKVTITPNMAANGDKNLLGLVLQNLLGNAWKYTGKTSEPRIEMGTVGHNGKQAYFVRDNGVGFDMTYADKLFKPFQRLHKATEFAGTGIGLATVQRIIRRHGGEVWAEAMVGEGATFYFTLN